MNTDKYVNVYFNNSRERGLLFIPAVRWGSVFLIWKNMKGILLLESLFASRASCNSVHLQRTFKKELQNSQRFFLFIVLFFFS